MPPSKEIDTISQTNIHDARTFTKVKKIWREAAIISFQIDEKLEEKPDGTARAVQTGKQLKSVMVILHAMCLLFKKEQLIWKQAVQMRF